MIISEALAAFMFLSPIATGLIFARMSWRAHREIRGKRYARLALPHGRRFIGAMLAVVALANVWTGTGFLRLIGVTVGLDIVGGALLVRFALLAGAAWIQVRYGGA